MDLAATSFQQTLICCVPNQRMFESISVVWWRAAPKQKFNCTQFIEVAAQRWRRLVGDLCKKIEVRLPQ